MISNIKTIFFDFDGTLHDSIQIYAPAFLKGYDYLVQNHFATYKCWNIKEISYWLGFNSKDMWKSFRPDLDENIAKNASNLIGIEMANQIRDGNGILYDGSQDTLQYLKDKKYHLVFLSNCGIDYKNLVKERFELDLYFDDMICSGDFNQISKYEILDQIKWNYPEEMVIIGDRFHDIEAGIKNHIYTIGCEYGYGEKAELIHSDYIIQDIKQLKTLL